MELEFQKTTISCLDMALREVQNTEQTLEIKLPEGMPDVGHIIAAWGQVIARSKEWRGSSVAFAGGVMVWVLYAPEDGSEERVLDGWMPFQLRWDIPAETREGDIRMTTRLRTVDARSVSARKIMVRAGVGILAEAFAPMEAEVFAPDGGSDSLELLRTVYPLRLAREAGEKTFLLDEDLSLPESLPALDKILCFRMNPRILDQKVLANKVVFRGSGNLHLVYRGQDGALHSWETELPFSQFAELQGEYGGDAQMDVAAEVTALELESQEEGRLRLKGGLVAQFLITDRCRVELIEDAYAPGRQVQLRTQMLDVPAMLDSRRETLHPEQVIPAEAETIVDAQFLPDFPIQRRTETAVELELPGTFQTLFYGPEGVLRASTARWSGQQTVSADGATRLTVIPGAPAPQAIPGSGQITVKAELPLDLITTAGQSIPMVTGAELGQPIQPDPGRPSLILRRAGKCRLWDIAKQLGTTPDAIRQANGLQEEPSPAQMLLIPIL